MNFVRRLKRLLHNTDQSVQLSYDIRNESVLVNEKLEELNQKLDELVDNIKRQVKILERGFACAVPALTIEEALGQQLPLLIAPKTYNTNHPDYEADIVRNFPGKIFNAENDIKNPCYAELKKLMVEQEIPESSWTQLLQQTLEEVKTVPHADQVFERKAYMESYVAALQKQYGAFYSPGWVNMEDALFLYWVVRHLKPKTIVQTGVCNGLSSAFMMLALAKNGPEGTLHVIDLPQIFDPRNSAWTEKGKAYGVMIPEGRTSGWIVPDAYRDRFEVQNGDAKLLLPPLLERLKTIDMFYHDSDHSYEHMIFEFMEAKKYLNAAGVVVSDDISWNASLWDFADQYSAPAYNYRGSMGIAFF